MKTFRMKADIVFQAEDITDAMHRLAKHFTDIKKGIDSQLIISGNIEVWVSEINEQQNEARWVERIKE